MTVSELSILMDIKAVADEVDLLSDVLFEDLYKNHSYEYMLYSREKSYIDKGEEEPWEGNPYMDFSFASGKKYPYIQFNFAIIGYTSTISNFLYLKTFNEGGLFFTSSHGREHYFSFRKYTELPLVDNEQLIMAINEEAKGKRMIVEDVLSRHNKNVDEDNIKMRDFIKAELLKEKGKRDRNKPFMNKLNPF